MNVPGPVQAVFHLSQCVLEDWELKLQKSFLEFFCDPTIFDSELLVFRDLEQALKCIIRLSF